MIQWVVNWLRTVADVIVSIIAFISSLIKSALDLVKLLPTVISLVVDSIGFLPSVLSLFATLSITVSIIFLIAGRNNN